MIDVSYSPLDPGYRRRANLQACSLCTGLYNPDDMYQDYSGFRFVCPACAPAARKSAKGGVS